MNLARVASDNSASAVVGPRPTNGVAGMVNAVATLADGTMIAGGEFSFAGRTAADRLAAWNGTSWKPVFGGLGGFVNDMKVLSTGTIAVAGRDLQSGTTFISVQSRSIRTMHGRCRVARRSMALAWSCTKTPASAYGSAGSLYDESWSEKQLFVFDDGAWSSRG